MEESGGKKREGEKERGQAEPERSQIPKAQAADAADMAGLYWSKRLGKGSEAPRCPGWRE